ncbi:MAG: electron transfer flavoprotein subunit alpha/FixB family protein [Deltaproteobacteria bacterium]|nr:electron transfer flavoprotein subunit alpha/FixB family protein [Deltaproteobacteria bacterium]
MGDIFVIAEHRNGKIRDVTVEMLQKAAALARDLSKSDKAVELAGPDQPFADTLAKWADQVLVFEEEKLKTYNSDLYTGILAALVQEYQPFITLMGHTSWGMDYAPALAVRTGYPLTTDATDILLEDGHPQVIRQMYSGKLFSRVSFSPSQGYMITVRPGAFKGTEAIHKAGEVVDQNLPENLQKPRREFLEFEDTAAGDVDITQADLLVSVGRGVGEADNIATVQELADLLGGTLSCSRPVVDKNWLPKYHQVGTSGKSVKPKVYLALGISGAFQHVAGITGASCVIAVNKDKKAPIFRVADYGIVDDLFSVVAALKEKAKG